MYHLAYGLLYLISLLPLRLLYLISDGLYVLLYKIIGYRKEVIMNNLVIAFPEKSHAERQQIAREFYHNFVDNFIEMLKLFSAGESFIRKHFVLDNPELYEQFHKQGKKCHLHLGHTFNWELA